MLRDYQKDAINAALSSEGNALVVLPTGAGKSFFYGGLIQKVLEALPSANIAIIQHRKELVEQNYNKFLKLCPEHFLKTGIYSASVGQKDIKQITFAQIQSIYNKANELPRINVLVVDECHLISASNVGIFRTFISDLRSRNPKLFICGGSATPFRMTTGMIMEGAEALFSDITYDIGMKELIDRGFLCNLKSKFGSVQANLKDVHVRHGEYVLQDMEEAFSPLTDAACEEICLLGTTRKHWLLFCTSVKHARDVARALNQRGIRAASIDGETHKTDRERIFKAFESGEIQALTNCEIATTGYDFPGIDLIAILRGTKSAGLFVQMCGRGLRTSLTKSDCLILDYAGNLERFGCIDNIRVRKKKDGFQLATKPVKSCPKCGNVVPISFSTCLACGYIFERTVVPHEVEASALPILSKETWLTVKATEFKVHNKVGKPPSLKVVHECENNITVREFLCFEHGGYPATKAKRWWKQHADAEIPQTTEQAFHSASKVKSFSKLKVVPDGDGGRFWKVLGYEHGKVEDVNDDFFEEFGINV